MFARTFFALTLCAVALAAPAAAAPGRGVFDVATGKSSPIVGTWLWTVAPSSGPSFMELETYEPSGSITAFDDAAPSSQETGSVGTYKQTGTLTYAEHDYQFIYDEKGKFVGTWIVSAIDTVSASGTSMSGPYTFQLVSAHGKVLQSGSGTSSAVRLDG